MAADKKEIPYLFLCVFSAIVLAGCAHIKEGAKKIWGSSIEHLEKARSEARVLSVNAPLSRVFPGSSVALKEKGAVVYLKGNDQEYLAAMNFPGYVDTTQVGLFFTGQEGQATKIEVASLSPRLALEVERILLIYFNPDPGAKHVSPEDPAKSDNIKE